ncbi:MAG: O-antigen ligase family protein [Phyllobacterium sp.]
MYFRQLMAAMMPQGKGMQIGLDRNNRIFVFLFALMPGFLASGASFLLVASFSWAILSLAMGRFRADFTKADRLVAMCMSAYAVVMTLGVLINPDPADGLKWIVRVLPFVSIWFVLPRLRQSQDGSLIPLFIVGAGIGMIGAFFLSIVQVLFFTPRAEGGAGNAAVFGLFAVLFGSIALLNLQSSSRVERTIAIAGFIAGLACAFLSGTRSAWLVMPVHLVILLWYFRNRKLDFNLRTVAIAGAVFLSLVIGVVVPQISKRVEAIEKDLALLEKDPEVLSSLSARVALYKGAIAAIAKDPLTGYGPQNRMDSVRAEVPGEIRDKLAYSHPHNGFLTAAVDAGIFGALALALMLFAPILAAWKKTPGPGRDLSIAFSLLLVSSYLITGMFGIMFGHDATDAIFAFTVAMICAERGTTALASLPELATKNRVIA